MTHLLGRQDCVESLRRDLIDLQGAVLDVFSRTGPVRFPSWKFPDKLSCNLDLVSLLEQYDYADGEEEFNQHSHIVLLELVIDRLMLLLQCFEAHAELALGGQRRHLRSCQSGASVSLGPVVKHYWNTLVRLSSQGPCTDVSRGSPGERRAPVRASCDAESTCPQGPGDPALRPGDPALRPGDPALRLGDPALRPGNPALRPGDPALRPGDPALRHSAGTALSAPKTRAAPGAPPSDPHRPALSAVSSTQHRSAPSTLTGPSNTPYTAQHAPPNSCPPPVSSCVRSVGSQTVASCLVPCQACALVQDGLRETGAALVAACCTLGLPCSLQRLLVAVDDSGQLGRLVAADVSQWASEQSRDMSRLTKHTLEVRGTVEPLKERLRGAEMEREELRRRLEREEEAGRREREQRRRREEELELRLQEEKRSREEERRRRQEEQDELRRGAASLQDRNSGLAAELGLQRETLHSLECERDALREEVRRLRLEEVTRVQEVEERRRGLEAEVDSTRLQLDKESAKYHSALRQQQAMQGKQQAVCERVEALTEECEDLQSRLDERDELTHTLSQERDTLQQQLMQQQEECVRLQARAAELEGRVCELGAELRQAVQRERLLVAFPELSQPSLPQSTGDVLSDMDQQLQSNSVRIKVLQQENTVLMTSLARLRQQESHPPSERQQRVTPSTG